MTEPNEIEKETQNKENVRWDEVDVEFQFMLRRASVYSLMVEPLEI